MTLNMVSEVDRNFYSNNLLSNEDLESSMDLSEILGMDTALSPEDLVRDFPDDFPTLTLDAMDGDTFSTFTSVDFHDDLHQEFSDSSDSGVSGVIGQYESQPSPDVLIKEEPLSPASSISSEGSDLTSSQSHKTYTDYDLKIETPQFSQVSGVLTGQGHNIPQTSFSFINDQSELGSQVILGGPAKTCSAVLTGFDTSININSILNSKVKIQPKPVSSKSSMTKPALPKTEPGKPLVLTPEEFKRLTAQGVLKFQPPPADKTTTKVEISKVTTRVISPPQVKMDASPIIQVDHEVKNVRRQQRMIKNRESASLSRKRKKEYLQTIEEELSQYNQQNQKLIQENDDLRRRLSVMKSENEELKRRSSGMASPAKKICLMAVLLFFTLNLGIFSDLVLTSRTSHVSNPSPDLFAHKGRQLLTVSEEKDSYSVGTFMPDYPFSRLKKFLEDNSEDTKEINNKTLYQLYTCPTYFNKTESMRLADQLSGWMERHEQLKKKKQRKSTNRENRPLAPSHPLRGELRNLREQRYRAEEAKFQLQFFQGDKIRNFWQSLPRRNDTFYVLSFNTDYLLIPAVAHNKTMRPRMSLVMPATTLNETMQPPAGNIGMMQIDCEVLNTQLIHVHKSTLPQHNTSESFFP